MLNRFITSLGLSNHSTEYDKQAFRGQMESFGMSEDLMDAMSTALEATVQPVHSIIFVATDGNIAVEAIHVPQSALEDGTPCALFSGANEKVIIAAWSKDYILRILEAIERAPEDSRDVAWEKSIQWMADIVFDKYKKSSLNQKRELS